MNAGLLAAAGASSVGTAAFGADYAARSWKLNGGNAGRMIDPHALKRLSIKSGVAGAAVGALVGLGIARMSRDERADGIARGAALGTGVGAAVGVGMGLAALTVNWRNFPARVGPGTIPVSRAGMFLNETLAWSSGAMLLGGVGGGVIGAG